MSMHHVRNIVTLLLILTLANLAASFAALRAVRAAQIDAQAHMQRVDAALTQVTIVTAQLCAERGLSCSELTVVARKP